MVFASNPRFLWSGQYSGPFALFDTKTGDRHSTLDIPGGVMVKFAGDSTKNWLAGGFAGGPFQGIIVWDAKTKQKVVEIATAEQVQTLAINPVKRQIAYGNGFDVMLLDVGSDSPPRKVGSATLLSFSPDGKRLAVGNSIFDIEQDKVLFTVQPSSPNFNVVTVTAIDGEGRILVREGISDPKRQTRCLNRVSPNGSKWETIFPDLDRAYFLLDDSFAFSPDYRLVAFAKSGENANDPCPIHIWDLHAKCKVKELSGHNNRILNMEFSPDGRKLASTAGTNDETKIWSLDDLALVDKSASEQTSGEEAKPSP